MHTPKAPQPPSPACEGGNRAPPPAEDGRRPDCSRKPLGRSFTGNVNDLPRPSPEASYGSFCGPCGVGGGFDRNVLAWTKAHCPSWTFGRPSGLVGLDVRLRRAVAGFGGGVAVLAAMTFQGPSAIRTKAIAAWTHKRPAKRPLTAFHGRCGKPAMFDMKGGPRAVYGPYGGGFAHARGVTLTQACPKRPANAPQTVFRGNMGTWPYPPSRTFQGPFTGPAADMVA